MDCNNCSVAELKFEFDLAGELNAAMLPQVVEHLKRREIVVVLKTQGFILPESGAKEFMDFCLDYMEPDNVTFRINQGDWKPFSEIETVMEMEWIDEVIKKELLTCHYQPIVDVDEQIFAYEMLSRFQNEDGSMIYPNQIFPAAKIRGRLYALDRVCRMTAVKYAAVLKNKKAFINFFPHRFIRLNFVCGLLRN